MISPTCRFLQCDNKSLLLISLFSHNTRRSFCLRTPQGSTVVCYFNGRCACHWCQHADIVSVPEVFPSNQDIGEKLRRHLKPMRFQRGGGPMIALFQFDFAPKSSFGEIDGQKTIIVIVFKCGECSALMLILANSSNGSSPTDWAEAGGRRLWSCKFFDSLYQMLQLEFLVIFNIYKQLRIKRTINCCHAKRLMNGYTTEQKHWPGSFGLLLEIIFRLKRMTGRKNGMLDVEIGGRECGAPGFVT